MGKRWAGTGRVGKRRIDDPGDFVRLEVVGGLRRAGLRMIPVLVGGAKMLGPTELPEDLRELSRRNAFELSDTRWKEDVARLTTELDRVMGPTATPATPMPAIQTPVISATPVLPQPAIRLSAIALPSWSKWAAIGVGVAAAVVVIGFVARGALAHRAPAPVVTAAPVSAPSLNVATDPPRLIPASLLDAGHGMLSDAQAMAGRRGSHAGSGDAAIWRDGLDAVSHQLHVPVTGGWRGSAGDDRGRWLQRAADREAQAHRTSQHPRAALRPLDRPAGRGPDRAGLRHGGRRAERDVDDGGAGRSPRDDRVADRSGADRPVPHLLRGCEHREFAAGSSDPAGSRRVAKRLANSNGNTTSGPGGIIKKIGGIFHKH